MKLIRFVFISVLLLFAVGSFLGLLLPSQVLVSRAVNVYAPKDSVIRLVNDIHQWGRWMDGVNDNTMHVFSTSSADINGTKVNFVNSSDSMLVTNWVTPKNKSQLASFRFITDSAHHVTVVQWQFEEKIKWYPWERLGSMMNDKILGPMMETNLNNLKREAEGKKVQL
jgi:hypothetical protein